MALAVVIVEKWGRDQETREKPFLIDIVDSVGYFQFQRFYVGSHVLGVYICLHQRRNVMSLLHSVLSLSVKAKTWMDGWNFAT